MRRKRSAESDVTTRGYFVLKQALGDPIAWILSNRFGVDRSEEVRSSIPSRLKRKNRFQPVDSRFSW